MERRRCKVLQINEVEDILAQSDVEDYSPSDEDTGDPAFDIQAATANMSSSSSETDSDDEEENLIASNRSSLQVQSSTGNRRSRGRRGIGSRPRGRSAIRQVNSPTVPSSSGSTQRWMVCNFVPKELSLSQPSYLVANTANLNKISDYVQEYVDDDLITLIVEKTNQTAVKLTGRSLNLDLHEYYTYIGITMVMATVNYPNLRMYWENTWRVDMIASNMSRNRFTQLRNSLKLVFDDDVTTEMRQRDKLWKVRPFIERIIKGCRHQEKQQKLSIDEMIIPFTGTCMVKQYCPGKPNPEGLKAFVLANPNGLVCDFHVYEGGTTYPEFEGSGFGLGEKAVLKLIDGLVPGHVIYFDRYFTSEKLIDELDKKGIGCSGTVMKNRIPYDAREFLVEDIVLKRRGRGSCQVLVRDDKKMAITKWFDNKAVTMMSSVEANEDADQCNRYFKQERTYKLINRPRVIRNYNVNMGGVDLIDRMLAVCPYRYRTKKWTQRFISHMFDLAVCNSWIKFKQNCLNQGIPLRKILQLREFKLQLGQYLIENNAKQYLDSNQDPSSDSDSEQTPRVGLKRKRGRPVVPIPSKKRRLNKANHMPTVNEKQSRCRQCHYKKSRITCSTCNVALCLTYERNCF